MKADPHTTLAPSPPRAPRAVLVEAAAVLTAGLLAALLLNAVSPHGLQLGRDYFSKPPVTGAATNQPASAASAPVPANAALARLRSRGLQPLEHRAAVVLFHEAQRRPESVIFVDVRNDTLYEAGHIPGAHPLDYYRPEAHLLDVLGACAAARQIVVYCTGGDCEDSELAANLLSQAGVPRERLFIYLGGFAEWSENGSPVAAGGARRGLQEGGNR